MPNLVNNPEVIERESVLEVVLVGEEEPDEIEVGRPERDRHDDRVRGRQAVVRCIATSAELLLEHVVHTLASPLDESGTLER